MKANMGQKVAYLILEMSFLSSIMILGWLRPVQVIELWLLPFLVLAVMRAAVTISENEIMAWLREPFTATVPDSCGAGESVLPKGEGWKRAVGGLIVCPICTGTWTGLMVVSLYAVSHNIGVIAILVLGAAGGSEMLLSLREDLCWNGRLARVQVGRIAPDQQGYSLSNPNYSQSQQEWIMQLEKEPSRK